MVRLIRTALNDSCRLGTGLGGCPLCELCDSQLLADDVAMSFPTPLGDGLHDAHGVRPGASAVLTAMNHGCRDTVKHGFGAEQEASGRIVGRQPGPGIREGDGNVGVLEEDAFVGRVESLKGRRRSHGVGNTSTRSGDIKSVLKDNVLLS